MKSISKFVAPDGKTVLTVSALQGKSGFNVRASIKVKGADEKAMTGARESFENAAEAGKAFTKLCEEAKKRGWSEKPRLAKVGAFTAIPEAPGKAAPVKKTA